MKIKISIITAFIILITLNMQSQNAEDAYDALDQIVWHAPSKTWFVSNLGGEISLEKDSNAWISRTDERGNVIVFPQLGSNQVLLVKL